MSTRIYSDAGDEPIDERIHRPTAATDGRCRSRGSTPWKATAVASWSLRRIVLDRDTPAFDRLIS
jgi:hypothetical protein